MTKQEEAGLPVLVDNYVQKIDTFNGGEIFLLTEMEDKVKEEWKNRVTCSICFVKSLISGNGIDFSDFISRVYLSTNLSDLRSLLFEKSGGKMTLPESALSASSRGQIFAHPDVSQNTDIHEEMHVVMAAAQKHKRRKEKIKEDFTVPMWYTEGLAQYFQNKKNNIDSFQKARELEYLPPFVVKEMNVAGPDYWLEFGIMNEYRLTGNHPGLMACASFIQFLAEKEKLGLKNVWELMFATGGLKNFYKKIESLCGQSVFVILNNYLYYVDKPFFPKEARNWEMPVAVGMDFRKKFVRENKRFKVMNLF